MKHHAHLTVSGVVGLPEKPAFALELTRGALVSGAKLHGIKRYGKSPGTSDDTRPLALAHRVKFISDPSQNLKSAWTKAPSNAVLLNPLPSTPGLEHAVYLLAKRTYRDTASYTSETVITAPNQRFAIGFYIERGQGDYNASSNASGFFGFHWGEAGAGYLFQVVGGKAELGGLSPNWTPAKQTTWRNLRNTANPTSAQETERAQLEASIFDNYQTLDMESGAGTAEWDKNLITLSFVPEPRGVLHVILEGGDAATHENTRIIETGEAGELWPASPFVVAGRGCDFTWQMFEVGQRATGTAEYGPFSKPPYPDALDDLTYRISADQSGGTVALDIVLSDGNYPTPDDGTLEGQLSTLGSGYFGLRATFTAGSSTPWLYGLSARTPQGEFVRNDPPIPTLDTENLYIPVGDGPREDGNPILDVNTVTERNGERHGSIIVRDVDGAVFADVGVAGNAGIAGIMNHRATLGVLSRDHADVIKIAKAPHFTEALITGARYTDARRFAFSPPGGGDIRQSSTDVAKGETRAEIEWFDGWQLLREKKCKPPLINDNLKLGAALNAVLKVAGFTLSEGVNLGPTIDGPALGEAWVSTNDANARCADVISGLLDRYGLGLRFYQNNLGAWILAPLATQSVADFTSDGTQSDPNLRRGGTRFIINEPLDWEFNYADYYNSFKLIWGPEGKERVYVSRIEESIRQPSYLNYLGREKEYDDVVATDIRTEAGAEYAMRSLKFRYGRLTKFATSNSFYHRDLRPGDPITVDGRACELQSIGGMSLANDAMQLTWGQLA